MAAPILIKPCVQEDELPTAIRTMLDILAINQRRGYGSGALLHSCPSSAVENLADFNQLAAALNLHWAREEMARQEERQVVS